MYWQVVVRIFALLALVGPPGAMLAWAQSDALPTVAVTALSPTVEEGVGRGVLFRIRRRPSDEVSEPLDVFISISGGASYGIEDETRRKVTITKGEHTHTLQIAIPENDIDQDDAELTVTVLPGTGYVVADKPPKQPKQATVTIIDNDEPLTIVNVEASPTSIDENGGRSTVTVTLSGRAPEGGIGLITSFNLDTGRDDLAFGDGVDFRFVGPFTISGGATSGTFDVVAIDDERVERDETAEISVQLGSLSNPPNRVNITITDDDVATVEKITAAPGLIPEEGGESKSPWNSTPRPSKIRRLI